MTRERYGMTVTLLRHAAVVALAAAAVVAQGGTLSVAIFDQPWSWLAVAIGLGILAAIIGRSLVGAVFLVFGFAAGIQILLVTQLGDAASAQNALGRDGYLYAAMLAAAVEAYLVTLLVLLRMRRPS